MTMKYNTKGLKYEKVKKYKIQVFLNSFLVL